MKTVNKILCILVCLIIIVGIIVWKNNGFNLELQYSARKQINISNNTGLNKTDVEQIALEVLGNTRHFVQEVEMFGNSISIVADEITEDQRNEMVKRINDKYKTDIDKNNVEIVSIPFTRIKDVIKPFFMPGIVTLVIVLAYFLIRFRDLGLRKILGKTVIIPIVLELLLYSIIAITRIPFGRISIACGIGLYVSIIAILTSIFENQKEKKSIDNQDK